IYTATLQRQLPKCRLPLAADDRDAVLDLQTVFSRSFDQANFMGQIDYLRDPPTRVAADDRKWLDEMLRQQKLRQCGDGPSIDAPRLARPRRLGLAASTPPPAPRAWPGHRLRRRSR